MRLYGVVLAGVVACGGGGGGRVDGGGEDGPELDGNGDVASATIGPAGGVIRLDGFLLSVPPRALDTPTQLTVRRTEESAFDVDGRSPVFRLEPDGLTFRRPVGVAIRTTGAGDGARIFWSDAGDAWRGHTGRRGPDHVAATGFHFSRVVAGVRAPCETPSVQFFSYPFLDGDIRAIAVARPEPTARANVVIAGVGQGGALVYDAIDMLTGSTRFAALVSTVIVTGPIVIGRDGVAFAVTASGVARVTPQIDPPNTEVAMVSSISAVAGMASGDFDEDGISDVVTMAAMPPNGLSVHYSGGGGYTLPAPRPLVGSEPVAVTVIDFNSDAIPDVLVTVGTVGNVSAHVYGGLGDGTFALPTVVPLDGVAASGVATAAPEAIAVDEASTSSTFAQLTGSAEEFTAASSLMVPGSGSAPPWLIAPAGLSAVLPFDSSSSLAASDVDGDGVRDRLSIGAAGVVAVLPSVTGPRTIAALPGNFVEGAGDDAVVDTSDAADGDDDLFVVGGATNGQVGVAWARRTCNVEPPVDASVIDAPSTDAAAIDAAAIDAAAIDAAAIDAAGNPWTLRTSGTIDGFEDVAWDGSRYVALSRAATLFESADGISWSPSSATGFEMFLVGFGIAYSAPLDRWVVVGDQSFDGRIYTRDGAAGTWTLRASPPERTRTVIWAGPPISRFIVGTDSDIRTSTDGITWNVATGASNVNIYDITWAGPGNNLVAVGANGVVRVSSDGINWTTGSSGTTDILRDVAGHAGEFVAVTDTSPSIFRSTDGGATFVDTQAVYVAGSVVWSGTRFDAFLYANGLPLSSPDGMTWTAGSSITGQTFNAITADGPRIVAVGGGGAIATREH